jgi:hypothetical protein
MSDTPPPGSEPAQEQGCTCPVMDNPYKGIEGTYIINADCPIHNE